MVKIFAVSSAGGHWIQLRRMRPAWDENCDVSYITTKREYEEETKMEGNNAQFYCLISANRWQKFRLILQLVSITYLIILKRPDVIISTGAALGYFAIRIGKLLGARTIWVDSIANADELSLSGQKVAKYADLWLTQWEHLAGDKGQGPVFKGAVI
ncbi:UDP-N-acetylglucosamine--LPS N-acetylglucosamine transferase [Sneathiella limimaris]|uniref:UDP-N-acetylglucosamine--LPS N-acetylglucosamine transferase n=1 Tax=Sneathiella limimaris TaxID=1964213 RepID=UPI00146A3E62|nr:UDP-N-acetylglucosamine--LPS N-acetylglucosamine transferase [Sneathiella limimaris]